MTKISIHGKLVHRWEAKDENHKQTGIRTVLLEYGLFCFRLLLRRRCREINLTLDFK